ncbi:uncharacterized protein [Rhodnius prolixus]|uniref:Uncharacterized protein n=1 Tax=Rhodnius prolixus TaxID=13249 RepID=T1I7G5_RHOPR
MLKVLANLLLVASVTPVRMRYDQSQIGDYNVHLDLKNIEIVAFLDDSSLANNEYDYDYAEMTLKPTTSTTDTANQTASDKPTLNAETNQTVFAVNSTIPGSSESSTSVSTSTVSTLTTNKTRRRCGAGFFRDSNGRCRRLRKPSIKLDGLLHQAKDIFMGKNNS